jgi:hypothetical protein
MLTKGAISDYKHTIRSEKCEAKGSFDWYA